MNYFLYVCKYQAFLRSPYWAEVRRRVWQRATREDGQTYCDGCGKRLHNEQADCHHTRYGGVVFRELEGNNLNFVWLLCRACHAKAHGKQV